MRIIRKRLAVLTGLFAILFAGSVVLAACGSSDDSGEESASNGSSPSSTTLVVGGWGSSYNQATQKFYADPFEASGGAKIKFDDAPGTQVAKLNAQNRAGDITWDMIDSVAGADGYLLDKQGLLEPLPEDLKTKFDEVLGEGKVSDFGFTMGNLSYAIVCNMDKMDTCPKTMEEFFDAEKFPQSRQLPSAAPLEVITMAEVARGVNNADTSTTEPDLDADMKLLDGVRSNVRVFWESGDQSEQVFRTGDVDMGLIWSGRAYRLQDEGRNLEINTAGGGYEPGYWTVTKGSKNKDEAFKFMEWIATHPDAQAKWSKKLSYSVPNPKALDLMTKKERERLPDYPPVFETLAVPNFTWYADNADQVNAAWQEYLRG